MVDARGSGWLHHHHLNHRGGYGGRADRRQHLEPPGVNRGVNSVCVPRRRAFLVGELRASLGSCAK